MSIGTSIYTWFYGNLVGEDDLKNKYYCNSKKFNDFNSKRWVMFNGVIEASKIPPHWHAWLHKTIDEPPINYFHKYNWQKNHEENLTGTEKVYNPDSHPLSASYSSDAIKSEYESWKP